MKRQIESHFSALKVMHCMYIIVVILKQNQRLLEPPHSRVKDAPDTRVYSLCFP